MNSTQNKKIEQVKETTMIVGIDVSSEKHYFRAFNWRGIELIRKPVAFSNSMGRKMGISDKEIIVPIKPTCIFYNDEVIDQNKLIELQAEEYVSKNTQNYK